MKTIYKVAFGQKLNEYERQVLKTRRVGKVRHTLFPSLEGPLAVLDGRLSSLEPSVSLHYSQGNVQNVPRLTMLGMLVEISCEIQRKQEARRT